MKKILKLIFLTLFLCLVVGAGFLGFRTYKQVKSVSQYQTQVEKNAKIYGVSQYTDLMLGIIMTESKGRGTDLMQSSESAYGDQGQIASQNESIKNGVKHFAAVYKAAKAADCDLATAVQAYNFGVNYIDYVKARGGKNTVELAEKYSRDVLSPVLGNQQETTYRYMNWQSLIYNGGYLYKNGGNMFYADVVKMNQRLIEGYLKVVD